MFYGATDKYQILECVSAACTTISPLNAPDAEALINGTFAAETAYGTARDNYEAQGKGLAQFDFIRFDEVRGRLARDAQLTALLKQKFGIVNPKFDQLDYSPLLSAIFCRIGYLYVPDKIPACTDINAQGVYWKKFWNSSAGAGTPEKYVAAQIHIPKRF